jgi:peroxiredoxin Q/BCP
VSWLRLWPGIRAGQPAPGFELLDEEGRQHRLDHYRGRWLLVFFYPQDGSPGCMREACRFNDDYGLFTELGCELLGCSGQDAESHRRFRQGCRLRYRLLSDPDRAMREAWGVPHLFRLLDLRSSYLIDPQGMLRWAYHGILDPEQHCIRALAFLRQHAAAL